MARFSGRTRIMIAIVALIGVGLVSWVAGVGRSRDDKQEANAPEAQGKDQVRVIMVTVAPVEKQAVQRMVTSVCKLNGFEEVLITPKVEGRVSRVYHEVGDRVKPGELLMELDPTDFELAVNEARRAFELELTRLELTELPQGELDVSTLPSVVSARLVLENAKRQMDREAQLREQKVNTPQQLEKAQTDYGVAEANLRQALLEARGTLAAARHRNAALAMAEQRLIDTKLLAPVFPSLSGSVADADYVIAERMVSEGEMVRGFPSTSVMRLVMDNPLKMVGPIPERYMGEVKLGQTVKLLIEAYPGEVFEGKVSRVDPTVDFESHAFQFEALIENGQHRLKAGGFAKAGILTRTDEGALTVPLEALVSFAGVTKVFVVRDGKASAVEVQTGVRGRGWVEITSKLDPDAMVVTSGQSQLVEGSPVSIRGAQQGRVAQRKAL